MIIGTGIDVVDIRRFGEALERTAGMKARIFTAGEQNLALASLAARFAAKEALAKALGEKEIFNLQDVEIFNHESGKPDFTFHGAVAKKLSGAIVHLTLSHDAGIASAMVIIERIAP